MGAPRLARRLWDRLWNRQSLGRIVIKFYPECGEASIAVSPALAALSRRYWHWLYLQHLAESLAAIADTQERMRLLVAARAMAEDFVSRASWPRALGESISGAGAGTAEIVPERAGGVALTAQVVQRGEGMPGMRLAWSPPQARDRVASANLVLLVHVMRGATHPLEQYELFKKIALFVEYGERARCPRERATLKAGTLYAVVHADLAQMTPHAALGRSRAEVPRAEEAGDTRGRAELPAGAAPTRVSAARPPRNGHASPDPIWKRSGPAIGAAAVAWAALVLGAFLLPRLGGPAAVPRPIAAVPRPIAAMPAIPRPQTAVPPPGREPVHHTPLLPRVAGGSLPAATRQRAVAPGRPRVTAVVPVPRPSPDREARELPKFRVVSGPLALGVAEHRSRVLAEQGVDAFVRERAGKIGRLQYGAYRSREVAEEDAKKFRAQGYTAVVIPY